jgi:hypothetical protein
MITMKYLNDLSVEQREYVRKVLIDNPEMIEQLSLNRQIWIPLRSLPEHRSMFDPPDRPRVILHANDAVALFLEEVQAARRARFRIQCGIHDGKIYRMVDEMNWREFGEAMKATVETEQAQHAENERLCAEVKRLKHGNSDNY